jgi:hypothetical protein
VGGVGRSGLGQHVRRWSAAVGAWVDAMICHRQKAYSSSLPRKTLESWYLEEKPCRPVAVAGVFSGCHPGSTWMMA